MKTLLLTPPIVQINTPYPATTYLAGFLKSRGHLFAQADASIELICRLLSRQGISRILRELESPYLDRALECIDDVVAFLQGHNPTLAHRLIKRTLVPEGPRFDAIGSLPGDLDQAKHIASLFLDDLADLIKEWIDPRFEFSRYGEKLAASQVSFDPMRESLLNEHTLIDELIEEITLDLLKEHSPDLVCLTVPFPGNLMGALRIAATLKKNQPSVRIAMGGGYVNTELRSLQDPRLFEFVDFILFDDGERPLECLIEFLSGKREESRLLRTLVLRDQKVLWISDPAEHDIPFRDTGLPTTEGLKLDQYISMVETPNRVNRLWTEGRWNKLTLAHGCYWKKCSFCDTTLDYIGRYDPVSVDLTLARIKNLISETGETGFHFVDEAAPPAALRALATRLIEEKISITWWGNIRFDKAFTPELCELLARSGCIAVTGGLEVASNRLLKLMQKGVSVEQVAQVTRSFRNAGIFVHAYLMYGFPTQTTQETIDSLEIVRQLFEADCLQSAFWHRFSATAHSPVGKNPSAFGIEIKEPKPQTQNGIFAINDLEFRDPTDTPHDGLGKGLKRALYNYMLGAGLDRDVRFWFEFEFKKKKIPPTTVAPDWIRGSLHPKKELLG